jgi:hypothetical protein
MKGENGVRGLAKKLIDLCEYDVSVTKPDPLTPNTLPDLIEYAKIQFGETYLLPKLLKYAIGFHHGGLPQEIRREMESAIQSGTINILICTSTLAEGVNLPIRTLVVHTIKRFDGEALRPIEKRSIKNIVGRVGRAGKETRGRIIFANNEERSEAENVFRDLHMEPAYGALFQLITMVNRAVTERNIQLNNELFEAQDGEFLSILDKIDTTLIDLMPAEAISEQIEHSVVAMLEATLAYKYCDTDDLKNRIKELFLIRARYLEASVAREKWSALKSSGSSPRFWKFINSVNLLQRPEWQSLDAPHDDTWIEEVILKLLGMPTMQVEYEASIIKKAILGWMSGFSYGEIAQDCNIEIDDALELLCHIIGYELQDAIAKLSQLALVTHGDENMSEIAKSWPTLLQYGLGDLQQLDMFERGASDRLGVWGVSRYLKDQNISLRDRELINFLRNNYSDVIGFLDRDPQVPKLSSRRTCEELKIVLG